VGSHETARSPDQLVDLLEAVFGAIVDAPPN